VIASKPAEFYDHDHIEDLAGRIYVVIGNTHPPGRVIAYLKYVPTNSKTFWCRGDTCFERVIKRYGVDNVLSSVRGRQQEAYDPTLGVSVPVISTEEISEVHRPRERFSEILRRPRDDAELDVILAYERLRRHSNVSPSSIGVDGSIAVRIHNPAISDVDLVVYGCRDAVEVAETASSAFERVPESIELGRFANIADTYGLPAEVVQRISAPYKRLYMKSRKREVNIMFSSDRSGRYGEVVFVPVGVAEAEVVIRPGGCESLYYPGIATVDRVVDLRVLGAIRKLPVDPGFMKVSKVVTYESLYSYPLYRGGEMRVRGVLSLEKPAEELAIVVGTRETLSYAVPKTA
jgi:predicted nucleotidyltransferase